MQIEYKKVVVIDVCLDPEDLPSLAGNKCLGKFFDIPNLGQEYHGQGVYFEVRVHLRSQIEESD